MASTTQISTTSAARPKECVPSQSNSPQKQSTSHELRQRARKRAWLWFSPNKVSS